MTTATTLSDILEEAVIYFFSALPKITEDRIPLIVIELMDLAFDKMG